MLEIASLTVRLGRRSVLQDVTFTARGGEVLAVCGANGAGKSTLLKAILQEIPAQGTMRLNGHDLSTCRPHALAPLRAVVPQDTEIAFGFTLAEIVAMGRQAGACALYPEIDALALAAVGLHGREGEDIRTFSGGERQRGHLARALAQVWQPVGPDGPCWLMPDEPVASLDIGQQLKVMQLARSFADAGGGVIAVMHDLNLSAMVGDRLAFLVDGHLAAIGPPDRVLQGPLLSRAYGCDVVLNRLPATGPWLLPQTCTLRAG